jgi:ABC-2 type transport system ATP-binding protein
VNVPIPAPATHTDVVGEPRLELGYRGTGLTPAIHVFGQIFDENRRVVVLGNQATPIPLTLDGKPHSISRALEGVAASAGPGSRYVLQITGGSSLYGPVRNAGVVTFSHVAITLPTGALRGLSR